jgi:hypothetical protein
MNHVLKYIHGVETLEYEIPCPGMYWADRTTHLMVRVVKFEEASQDMFPKSAVHLEIVRSRVPFSLTVEELRKNYVRISTPPSEKPFAWLRKFFEKRRTLSVRDLERTPQDKLEHLYVMNGLTVESFMKHRTFTKIPFPIPKQIIPIRKPEAGARFLSLSVWESWAPVDLLEQYDPSTILASKEFRDAVAVGSLYVLSEKYAKRLLSQQETQAEIERLAQMQQFIANFQPSFRAVANGPTDNQPAHYADLEADHNTSGPNTLSKNVEIMGDFGRHLS